MALRSVSGRSIGRGWSTSPGDAERRAVRQDAGGGADRELAERQQVGVELELRQAVAERAQPGRAAADQPLEIALLLLQMLRLQEQPLRPDDLVLPAHLQVPAYARPAMAAA